MAPIQPARPESPDPEEPGAGRGRRAARYAVPVAVAGIAAATISLVPALADAGDPSLPSVAAEQLLTKIAASDTRTVDGAVKVTTDLGLPEVFGGAAGGLFGGGAPGPSGGRGPGTSPAAPEAKLPQLLIGTHRLHIAADGPDRQKVSLIEPAAEYSVIHNGTQVWAYDSASNQAYHAVLPAARAGEGAAYLTRGLPVSPQDAARRVLSAAEGTASVTVDGTSRVAGHRAYDLLVTPLHAGSTTVGAIRIAVDGKTGVPLKLTLTPKGGGKAVFDIGYTKVGFGKPAARTFAFTPPKGVKVTEAGQGDRARAAAGHARGPRDSAPDTAAGTAAGPTVLGSGWDAIAVLKAPGGLPAGAGHNGRDKAASLLGGFGKPVSGAFGSGTLFHTRLVNALLTDKGALYVGAVTQAALTDAANSAAK